MNKATEPLSAELGSIRQEILGNAFDNFRALTPQLKTPKIKKNSQKSVVWTVFYNKTVNSTNGTHQNGMFS
jgi:hypothetical protein